MPLDVRIEVGELGGGHDLVLELRRQAVPDPLLDAEVQKPAGPVVAGGDDVLGDAEQALVVVLEGARPLGDVEGLALQHDVDLGARGRRGVAAEVIVDDVGPDADGAELLALQVGELGDRCVGQPHLLRRVALTPGLQPQALAVESGQQVVSAALQVIPHEERLGRHPGRVVGEEAVHRMLVDDVKGGRVLCVGQPLHHRVETLEARRDDADRLAVDFDLAPGQLTHPVLERRSSELVEPRRLRREVGADPLDLRRRGARAQTRKQSQNREGQKPPCQFTQDHKILPFSWSVSILQI